MFSGESFVSWESIDLLSLIGNDDFEERDTNDDDNPQSSLVELHSFINVETVIY